MLVMVRRQIRFARLQLRRALARRQRELARIGQAGAGEMDGAAACMQAIRRQQWVAAVLLGTLFLGLGGWAALARISGAVIMPGTVVVETNPKRVQHLEGGIVAHINVRNGDRVAAGDPLVRMDDIEARANLLIIEGQLQEMLARRARLIAERDLSAPDFPTDIPVRWGDGLAADPKVWDGQRRLMQSRRSAQDGKKQQSLERIRQIEEAIAGLAAQNVSRRKSEELTLAELNAIERLDAKQLTNISRLNTMRREAVRIEGELAQTVADIARYRVQIAETQSRMLEEESTFMSDVLNELRDIEGKLNEAAEKRVATQAKLRRAVVVAPRAGIVHNLNVHTVGGVLSPGEALMEIVPEEDTLVLDAKLATSEIDQVRRGQMAMVRFTALDQRTTPEIDGKVTRISANSQQDTKDGPPYYSVRVELSESELARLNGKKLIPGMPAEIHVQTGARTVLDYLVKPMGDQVSRVFKER